MVTVHNHLWEEHDGTALLSTGRLVMQLQHKCSICNEIGIGPVEWCKQEHEHNHVYEPLPIDPLRA